MRKHHHTTPTNPQASAPISTMLAPWSTLSVTWLCVAVLDLTDHGFMPLPGTMPGTQRVLSQCWLYGQMKGPPSLPALSSPSNPLPESPAAPRPILLDPSVGHIHILTNLGHILPSPIGMLAESWAKEGKIGIFWEMCLNWTMELAIPHEQP